MELGLNTHKKNLENLLIFYSIYIVILGIILKNVNLAFSNKLECLCYGAQNWLWLICLNYIATDINGKKGFI